MSIDKASVGILKAVADHDLALAADAGTVASAVELLGRMSPGSSKGIWTAFLAISLRAIETRILCDPEIRKLALYWDALLGDADAIITNRIEELTGAVPPANLVAYIRACVRGQPSRTTTKRDLSLEDFRRVAEVLASASREVRCSYCGYHFRPEDLAEDRKTVVEDLGLLLTSTLHPRRLEDPLKPHQLPARNGQTTSLTTLTIDHVVPEAGFGWTEADNLAFACKFCNMGRQVYRRGPEPVSVMVASSPHSCSPTRAHSMPRQISLVASIICAGRRCQECGDVATRTELTATLGPSEVKDLRWLTFWNVRVVCYNCFR